MEGHAEVVNKKRLSETIDRLTEENQRHFLGVLEALTFAQNTQNQADMEPVFEEKGSFY